MNTYIANESTVLSDAEVQGCIPAFSTYTTHVRAYWPRPCTLKFVPKTAIPSDGWQIIILDDSDQQGALGYHDYTPGGKPISYVFAKTDKDNGYSWTVTLTHELAEMMADPYIATALQVTNTTFYAQEVGDPVEADKLGYTIRHSGYPDVLVSDFVTPGWFIPGHPGPVYDHAKHVTKPLQILPEGYMSIFVSGQGWKQVNHEGAKVALDAKDPRYRGR